MDVHTCEISDRGVLGVAPASGSQDVAKGQRQPTTSSSRRRANLSICRVSPPPPAGGVTTAVPHFPVPTNPPPPPIDLPTPSPSKVSDVGDPRQPLLPELRPDALEKKNRGCGPTW